MVFINADGTIRHIAEHTVPQSLADHRQPRPGARDAGTRGRARRSGWTSASATRWSSAFSATRSSAASRAATLRLPAWDLEPRFRLVGAWRSLVARLFWVQEAAGSNPAAPTIRIRLTKRTPSCVRVSSSARRPPCSPAMPAPATGCSTTQPTERERNDPLMGWWGSSNTQGQVRLRFDTADRAVAYRRGQRHRLRPGAAAGNPADQAQGLRRQFPLRPGRELDALAVCRRPRALSSVG